MKFESQDKLGMIVRQIFTSIELYDHGQLLGTGNLEYVEYLNFGLVVNVIIISSLTNDYYITTLAPTINDTNGDISSVRYQIRIIPMILLLWVGGTIVLIAMMALVVISLKLFIFSYKKKLFILSKEETLAKTEKSV